MSVNPSSFSSVNLGKLLGEELPQLKTIAQPSVATPTFAEPEKKKPSLNLTDAAAAKSGISVQTQRTRLTPAAQQDKDVQYQPGKLTGKNGKVYNGDSASIADDERFGILVENIGKDDSRETILYKGYAAAAKAAGYDDATSARIASALVDEQKQIEDSTGEQRATTFNDRTKAPSDKTHLDDVRASGELRFKVSGVTLKHIEAVNQRQISQQNVINELAKGALPSDELLQKAGVDRAKLDAVLKEIGWQPVPTLSEAVDKLAAEKKAEVLARRERANQSVGIDTSYTNSKWYGMTDAQITAETRREAETDIKRAIGKGELQVRSENQPATISAYTPTLADRARPLVEKYLPGLAALNTQEGIKTTNAEAFAAGFINSRLFGATNFYVDKSRFRNERDANEAWAMQKAGQFTGEFQNLMIAGKTVEAAMATPRLAQAVKALNESGAAGRAVLNALPSAVAFGGVETTKEAVKAAQGKSEGVAAAIANITRAGATGAAFGIFQPLPLYGRVPAVAASSYGIERVFGANGKDAALSAGANAVFAALGGRAGRAAEELNGKTIRITGENGTAANVKVSVDAGRRIVLTEVAATAKADFQVKVGELKAAAQAKLQNGVQYLRDKVTVTDAEVTQARQTIAKYKEQQAKTPLLSASLYMPPMPDNPKVYQAATILAKKTLADGTTNFTDFSRRVMETVGKKGQEVVASRLDKLFAENASEAVVRANQTQLQAFNDFKANFQAIADFRVSNSIPKYEYGKNAQGESTGTVAFAKANGQVEFGTNTTVGEKYLGGKNETLRKQAIQDIQTKLGKLQGARYNDLDTKFLTHAEAESFLKLAQKNGGKLPAEVELYSDRPTCPSCQGTDLEGEVGRGLSLLAELYGVKKLTVHDSYGTTYIIKPNQRTEVIR